MLLLKAFLSENIDSFLKIFHLTLKCNWSLNKAKVVNGAKCGKMTDSVWMPGRLGQREVKCWTETILRKTFWSSLRSFEAAVSYIQRLHWLNMISLTCGRRLITLWWLSGCSCNDQIYCKTAEFEICINACHTILSIVYRYRLVKGCLLKPCVFIGVIPVFASSVFLVVGGVDLVFVFWPFVKDGGNNRENKSSLAISCSVCNSIQWSPAVVTDMFEPTVWIAHRHVRFQLWR